MQVKPVKATAMLCEIRAFLEARRQELERLPPGAQVHVPLLPGGRMSLELRSPSEQQQGRTDSAAARLAEAKRVGSLEFWPLTASLGRSSSESRRFSGEGGASVPAESSASGSAARAFLAPGGDAAGAGAPGAAASPERECGAPPQQTTTTPPLRERRTSLPLILESSVFRG